MGRRRSVVVSLAHREAVSEHRAQLVNLTAEREARREPETDNVCRDCGRPLHNLAELVGHYDTQCRPPGRDHAAASSRDRMARRNHPAGGGMR